MTVNTEHSNLGSSIIGFSPGIVGDLAVQFEVLLVDTTYDESFQYAAQCWAWSGWVNPDDLWVGYPG
jgi:hypothetical protein